MLFNVVFAKRKVFYLTTIKIGEAAKVCNTKEQFDFEILPIQCANGKEVISDYLSSQKIKLLHHYIQIES